MGIFNFLKRKNEAEAASAQESPVQEAPVQEPEAPAAEEEQPALTSLSAFTEEALPSASGLYPHEILMLHLAPAFHPENNSFQKFWLDVYGVCAPQTILDRLLEQGYIEVSGMEEAISHLTVTKLRELLQQFGLSPAGKKAEMVRRLLDMEDQSQLEALCPERYFVRTEKGEKELKENWYVPYLHSHRNAMPLTIWAASKQIRRDGKDFSQILLETLKAGAEAHLNSHDYGQYRNACLANYAALQDAGMDQEAFHCLCETAYYDLSGLGDGETLLLDESPASLRSFLTAKEKLLSGHFMLVVPAVKQSLRQEQERRELSDEDFRALLLEEFGGVELPFQLFSNEECADLLLAVIHDDTETPARLLDSAKTRLQEELSTL